MNNLENTNFLVNSDKYNTAITQNEAIDMNNAAQNTAYDIKSSATVEDELITDMIVDDFNEDVKQENIDKPIETSDNAPAKVNINRQIAQVRSIMDEFGLNLNNGPQYFKLADGYKMNENLMADVKKLEYASANGLSMENVFVPVFSADNEAINDLKAGDTFQIEGSNKVSMKLSDGTTREFNLSPEKYLEFFPPVEKYSILQGGGADCYLLSTLDGAMKTPNGFAQILSCFNENEDGSVSASFPNGMYSITLPADKSVADFIKTGKVVYRGKELLNENSNPEDFLANTAKGIQMLEYLYGFEAVNKSDNSHALLAALEEETPDTAKIAELHHYYEEELHNEVTPNILRLNGGEDSEAYGMFSGIYAPAGKGREYIQYLKDCPEMAANTIGVGGVISSKNEELWAKYNLSGGHAYSVCPYMTEEGEMRFYISDPYKSSFTLDITESEMNDLFLSYGLKTFNLPE